MAKQNVLLVDADSRSLRVLKVSLRKAGYSVATCTDAKRALEMVDVSKPDLIVSDTRLPGLNGFEFIQQLRRRQGWADIPFMFLSSDGSVESKVRGLELGVEDYLTKPIYIKEILTRVHLGLQRRQRQGLELRESTAKTHFAGSLADMGLVDLLQTIDISRKSGVLYLTTVGRSGAIYFQEGKLLHAELGKLRGERAVYRFLIWNEGNFDLDFRPVRNEERTIQTTTQGLLMEGMRRVDEWGRLLEQLPPLDSVFEVHEGELIERLAEIPDEINDVLKLFDGQRSLLSVVDEHGDDDLATLTAISKLYFEGLIFDTGRKTTHSLSESDPPSDLVGEHLEVGFSEGDVVPGAETRGVLREPRSISEEQMRVPTLSEEQMRVPTLEDRGKLPEDEEREETGERELGVGAYRPTPAPMLRAPVLHSIEAATGTDGTDAVLGYSSGGSETEAPPKEAAHTASEVRDPEHDGEVEEEESSTHSRRKRRSGAEAEASSESNVILFPAKSPAVPVPVIHGEAYEMEEAASDVSLDLRGKEAIAASSVPEPLRYALSESELRSRREAFELIHPITAESSKLETPQISGGSAGLTDRFFRAETYESVRGEAEDGWEDDDLDSEAEPMSLTDRRARRAVVAISLGSLVLIGGFLAYQKVFLPQPERLGSMEESQKPLPAGDQTREKPREEPQVLGRVEPTPQPTGVVPPSPLVTSGSPTAGSGQSAVQPSTQTNVDVNAEAPKPTAEPAVLPETPKVEAAKNEEPKPITGPTAEPAVPPQAAKATVQTGEATLEPASEDEYQSLMTRALKLRGRKAEEIYRQALALNPQGRDALVDLAFLLLNRGQNIEAAELAARATSVDGTSSKAWITLGAARQAIGDRAAAMDAYRKCVEQGKGSFVHQCRLMLH